MIGLVEDKTLGREILLQSGVELGDIFTFLRASGIKVLGGDGTHAVGQSLPGAAIGQEPIAVPHVIGHRAVFLHLVELGRGDDR